MSIWFGEKYDPLKILEWAIKKKEQRLKAALFFCESARLLSLKGSILIKR